jgi:predicted CxxxxCH...CXXCH cytochrome family protein
MGKIMRTKIKGMSLKAKTALISLFTLLLVVSIYQVWRHDAQAAIANPQAWSSVYAGTAFPAGAGYTYAIGAGSDRLLVVGVSTTATAAATQTCTVTWGGKTLTQASGDGATSRIAHTFLFYLKESDIASATGSTLIATVTGGTTSYNFVRAAVYTGVNQSAPISMSSQFTSGTTASSAVGPLSPTLTIATGERAVEIINLTRTGSATLRTITVAAPWTTLFGPTGGANGTLTATNCYVLGDTTVGTNITSSYTASSTAFSSIAAMVISPVPSASNLTVNGNWAPAAASQLDTASGVLMQRVTATGSGTLELNSLTLDDIGSASAIASAEIYVSPTSQNSLPGDAVLVGSAASWAGTSTVFDLTAIGGTQAARTLTGTTPKYIYIVYDMSSGQASQTVRSTITGVGVVSPNIGATGLALSSNVVTLAYSGNMLQVTAPVVGAPTAKDSDAGVVMQHFKVDCDSAFDNTVELNSLTLQALGSATQVSALKIYISTSEDASPTILPATAKLVGQIVDWDKSSTAVPLTNDFGATNADRSISAGASKYVYVVYDMFYPDDADYALNPNANITSEVIGLDVVAPDIGATGLGYFSNSITLSRGTWSKITSCGGCHATATLSDAVTRDPATGKFPGSHGFHNTTNNIDCSACHAKPTVYNHANGFINFSGDINGGKYSRAPSDAVVVSNSNIVYGTCTNARCHGASSPVWGANTSASSCVKCHGVAGTTPAQYTANQNTAAPGYNGTGRDTGGAVVAEDAQVGAHDAHLRGLRTISNPIVCTECHTVPATPTAVGHNDSLLPADVPMNGALARDNGAVPVWVSGTSTCTATYCHFGKPTNTLYSPAVANASVVWSNSSYLVNTTADCQKCHLSPPLTTGVHAGKAFPASCNTCHAHVSTAGVITDVTKHINGIVDASGGHAFPYSGSSHLVVAGTTPWSDCSGCHNTTATGVTYATWASTGRGTAPNCTVCHLGGLKVASGTSSCWDCHGTLATDAMPSGASFPNLAGSHTKHVVGQGMACSACHNGGGSGTITHGSSNAVDHTTADVNVASPTAQFTFSWAGGTGKGTCSTVACHGTAEWGVTTFDCISCHSAQVAIAAGPLAGQQRAAVAASLKTSGTRNHKGTAVGADATKWDCIVCHMEGDYASGSTAPSYHGNGIIDFRDPDTGVQVKKVQWTGVGAAGAYTDTLTNYTTSRFTRNLAVTLENDPQWLRIASVQQNLCLKCHDTNGATNANAWTKNSGGTVVGTALRPFGLAVGSTSTLFWVSATNRQAAANTIGSVMDVNTMLTKTNASYHPVTGKANNGFTGTTRMKAPWNTATTPTAKVARTNTVYGWLVSCFDCHATQDASGLQTGTVVAHGNSSTTATPQMRQKTYNNVATATNLNLCTVCHADTYATTSNAHGSGSALGSGPASMSASTMGSCYLCHGTAAVNAATRAISGHGFDGIESTGANFTGGRPYAFIRGAQWTTWSPGTCQNSCTTGSYSPGGVY